MEIVCEFIISSLLLKLHLSALSISIYHSGKAFRLKVVSNETQAGLLPQGRI